MSLRFISFGLTAIPMPFMAFVFGEKVFDVVIYKSIRFAEASVASQAILEYASRHKGADAYRKLAGIVVAAGASD